MFLRNKQQLISILFTILLLFVLQDLSHDISLERTSTLKILTSKYTDPPHVMLSGEYSKETQHKTKQPRGIHCPCEQ